MSINRKWIIGYFIAFVIMIIMNYSVGSSVGNVADDNPTIIQPAGFAFSIWGLIYVLLLIWMIRLFFSKNIQTSLTEHLKFWPILNFLLNGLWIVAFTQQWMLVSTIIIAALLYTLAEMYSSISETNHHWFDRIPFSIYFAWVTLATIVNIFTLASAYNVDTILGMDELTWTILVLVVAGIIGIAIAVLFKDWLYPLVLIWPLVAIYAESGDVSTALNITLLIVSILLALVAIMVIVNKMKSLKMT